MRLMPYPGGKAGHLDYLLPKIPYSHAYVEPFGGGASVLLNRRKSPIEVINDLDHVVSNLYRVLRDQSRAFRNLVEFTPYSRGIFSEAVRIVETARENPGYELGSMRPDSVTLAWAFYTQMGQAVVGSTRRTEGQWSKSMASDVTKKWSGLIENLDTIMDRFAGVQIEGNPALKVIEDWDAWDTVFYLDPPYVLETRTAGIYWEEMADEDHVELVEALLRVEGAVVLSGYDHSVYDPLEDSGWTVGQYEVTTPMSASHRKKGEGWDREPKPRGERVEVVWTNPRAIELTEGVLFT